MTASPAATSVMGSVIDKLAALLNEEDKLTKGVKRGIRFLQNELRVMNPVLKELAEKDDDQIDPRTKDWRSKVRELSYDIEDCIDRFILNHNHGSSKANFVRKAMRKLKTLSEDRGITEEIQKLKIQVTELSEWRKHNFDTNESLLATPQPVFFDPRVLALYQEARDLVGIDGPREDIIKLLKCDEKQHKVVSIYGTAGQGKTTLAMEVYHTVTEAFDSRAFVSISRTPDMKKVLRDILSQISKSDFHQLEGLDELHLIHKVRESLKDKRYFILIDDIWSVSAWAHVQSALPVNDNGSRIITATCVKDVALSCCSGIVAQMYEAKPLSDEDSERLLYKRLFFRSEDCPQDLRKVCTGILKKCCGLPLAIITIAGLLANTNQTVEAWGNVLRSISAVDKDSAIERMNKILSLTYFDLPHNLKSCVLYLSVFPKDYSIDCQQLILLWVAEGLIPGHDRESMEQLGRRYLNELINRSLVQPTNVGVDGKTVKQCTVHDVMLEFIVSKAVEDNFVTIWNGNGFSENYFSSTIRRLSIQKDVSARAEEIGKAIKNAAHIRSISIFGSNLVLVVKHAPDFFNSQVLRVLNIERTFPEYNLGHVKCFGQLKYLRSGLKLPGYIEKLQHLQTLDVRWASLENLPTCIIQLHKLVRLFVPSSVRLPDGIGNLQALVELSTIDLSIQSLECIQGLSDLTNLRVLEIVWSCSPKLGEMEGHNKACISMLSRILWHLQELCVWESDPDSTCSFMASCVHTPPLKKLVLDRHNLNMVGPQISSLVNLSRLYIDTHGEIGKEGINILASLPLLLSLTVVISKEQDGDSGILYAISSQGFQRLIKFNLWFWCEAAVEFEPGAMPELRTLKLRLRASCQFKHGEGGLVLGVQNMGIGLKHVAVSIDCDTAVADEAEALEDDIRGAAAVHPNRPMLQVKRKNQLRMAQGCSRRPA